MSTFDLWLQTQPDDAPEPTARNLADARDQLSDEGGEMPSDDEVYNLACMLAADDAEQSRRDAEEYEADSINDDRDREGDGP
jgi:hypothetical protein